MMVWSKIWTLIKLRHLRRPVFLLDWLQILKKLCGSKISLLIALKRILLENGIEGLIFIFKIAAENKS